MSDSGSTLDALQHSGRHSQHDAFISASESSEASSLFAADHSRSRGRPRRRTTLENSVSSQSRLKRLKSVYNDGYRALFNNTVNEIASSTPSTTDDLLEESQFGVSVWSSEEKGAFFRALARRGRHEIRAIATDIGTKSEPEVYMYSDMLRKAAIEQQTYQVGKDQLDFTHLGAALDVQEDCCAALDLAAEALSALQQNEEEKAEKNKYKELAFLTPRIARRLDRHMAEFKGDDEELRRQIPAATVLNLMNFLVISKRFFMNSIIPEENWRSYKGRSTRSPSIMYTAFSDFYTLLISITQRLVQSTLFFAMSRLKAMSASGHYVPGSHIRRRDVIAAINVLGLKTDAKDFWAMAARKCKLRVYDKVRHRQVIGKRYSYVEVERILSPSTLSDLDNTGMTIKNTSTATSTNGKSLTRPSASVSGALVLSDSTSSILSTDGELSATPLHSTTDQDLKYEGSGGSQDADAEALDHLVSRHEEHRLWKMLGKEPAEEAGPIGVKLPKGSFTDRENDGPLDWTKLIDYAGDWETHEIPVFENSSANDRGFTQDVDSAAGLTSSGSSSNDLTSMFITRGEHGSASDKDAGGDGAINDNWAYASSAHNANHRAWSDGSEPDSDLWPLSFDGDAPAIEGAKRRSPTRLE